MHPPPDVEHRTRTLEPAAADGDHFVERRMTGQQIGRPPFDHPGQMGLGQCVAQAQSTGKPCSTSPMALRRTIKIRGAELPVMLRNHSAAACHCPKGSFQAA